MKRSAGGEDTMKALGAGASGAAEAASADIKAPRNAALLVSDYPAGPAGAPTDEKVDTNATLPGILAEGSRGSADTTEEAPTNCTPSVQVIRYDLKSPSHPAWKVALASQPDSLEACPSSPSNAITDAVQSTSLPAATPLRQQPHEQHQQHQQHQQQQQLQPLNSQQQSHAQSQPAQQPVKQAPAALRKAGNVVIQTEEEARLELLGGAGSSNGSPLAGLGRLMEWRSPLPHTVSRNLVRYLPREHCSARLSGSRAVDAQKITAFPQLVRVPLFAGRPYLRAPYTDSVIDHAGGGWLSVVPSSEKSARPCELWSTMIGTTHYAAGACSAI